MEQAEWHFFTPQVNSLRKCTFVMFLFHLFTVVVSFGLVVVRRAITIIIFNVILLVMDFFGLWIYLRQIHSFFLCYLITFWVVIFFSIVGMVLTAVLSLEPEQIFIVHIPLLLDIVFAVFLSVIDAKLRPYKKAIARFKKQIDSSKPPQ